MSLDFFTQDQTDALADASNRIVQDLPAGFSESLATSWRFMTDWHSSVAYQASRAEALAVYGDDIYQRTGERLPTTALGEGLISPDEFNVSVAKLNEKLPVNLAPLSETDVDRMAVERMAKAKRQGELLGLREKTWGGTFGGLLGTLAGGIADPITAMTLPLGGAGELGVLGRALEFAGISGGSEAAIAALSAGERERAAPGSAKEIPGEIASATVFGGLLGGAFGALGKWLKAGDRTLPTSLRDEVNAGTSDAQINATNVFPTAEGEIAGRDAITKAVAQAAKGEPITVGNGFDHAHVQAFADAAGAHDAESMAQAGDRSLRPLTFDERPNVEHFDRIPDAGEDATAYWTERLKAASPEERAALGATDAPVLGERSSGIALTSEAARARDVGPNETAALAADPQTYEAVQRNLDRIRLDRPDATFSVQTRLPDGTFRLDTRPLEEVLSEIDGMHEAGKELMACATGMMAAE